MAVTSKEAAADPVLKAALTRIFTHGMPEHVAQFPLKPGSTIVSRLPAYERWVLDIQTHGEYDDYWKQRGYAISEYYAEHADVPTLYLGGWYDSYARNTCESFTALRALKQSPRHLLMGPWTHGAHEVTYAGDIDFGLKAPIHYHDLKLAWFDPYLKGLHSEVADWSGKEVILLRLPPLRTLHASFPAYGSAPIGYSTPPQLAYRGSDSKPIDCGPC
ncbi:hypothetical protein NKDENANG_01250 [Candidatus Entotheonellaceae bacterium PAL068K]